MHTKPVTQPVEVFYSYSHKDEALRDELEKHLSSLSAAGYIKEWHDRQIAAGREWDYVINVHLNSATIILLLISPDFMASHYCYSIEMTRAMERHEAHEALVIPILLRAVDYEHAPFAKLQMLPLGARPIQSWTDRDEAFLKVSQGIREVIEHLDLYLPAQALRLLPDITRSSQDTVSHFMSLENYLKPSKIRFPAENDFAQGLVYLHSPYADALKTALYTHRRVLLTGPAAAGKTVQAIALARQLQMNEHYQVAYRDVARAREGEGQQWYELMRIHDRSNVLYILDNCHLAPREVNEFCQQWEEHAPQQAHCLLISRSLAEDLALPTQTLYYYLELCSEATITIKPEETYGDILALYAATYQDKQANFYTPLEEDSAALLEKQHAHNLILSKGRLEVWSRLGGRLSEVSREAIYQTLLDRYFSSNWETLRALCVLRRYEIRAHNFYVEKRLAQEEIKRLSEESLLSSTTVPGYGMLYDLALHPIEAQELLEALIYRENGYVTREMVQSEVIGILHAYLSSSPSNYMAVYESLSRHKQREVLIQLLRDRRLQDCAASRIEHGSLYDVLRYIHKLSYTDSQQARELLGRLAQNVGKLRARMQGYSLQEHALMLRILHQIDTALTLALIDQLDFPQLLRKTRDFTLSGLFLLLRTLHIISVKRRQELLISLPVELFVGQATTRNLITVLGELQEFGYPGDSLAALVNALDLAQLAEQSQREHLHRILWLLRAIKKVSPSQAQALFEHLPSMMLIAKANTSNMHGLQQLLTYMHELHYSPERIQSFLAQLDMPALLLQAEDENIQHLFWLLRTLHKIAPAIADALLADLTPRGLADLCRSQKVAIAMIEQFHKVVGQEFWQRFLRQFSPQDMIEIFERSPLNTIGSFLRYRYFYFRLSYQRFQEQRLADKLASESLSDITSFIRQLKQVPEVGEELAEEVLNILVTTDLATRLAQTDLDQLLQLLATARTIQEVYADQLLAPLRQADTLRSLLSVSQIEGIQRFIQLLIGKPRYLPLLTQALRSLEEALLIEKLTASEALQLGYFIWNVYAYLDEELARGCCQLIDRHLTTRQLAAATLDDLCFFFWNLVAVSNLPELQTLYSPRLTERLLASWDVETGPAAALLGILAIMKVHNSRDLAFNLTFGEQQRNQFTYWLKQQTARQKPFQVALALYGIRASDHFGAQALLQSSSELQRAQELLASSQKMARNPRSQALLTEIHLWLKELLRHL